VTIIPIRQYHVITEHIFPWVALSLPRFGHGILEPQNESKLQQDTQVID
jgi:hypothetical protein